jgi:hypothetical protein
MKPRSDALSGDLEGQNSVFLDSFEMGATGKMKNTRRSIFPVSDASKDKGKWRFELPRQAGTILVRKQKSGRIVEW